MKVLHISTFDRGGAAIACLRLHKALIARGIDSRVLVCKNSRNYPLVFQINSRVRKSIFSKRLRQFLYFLKLTHDPLRDKRELARDNFKKGLPKEIEYFSFPESCYDVTESALYQESDIVHLHWVSGFLDYPSFFKKNRKSVIWTLHDMEPFQGGLHYMVRSMEVNENGKPNAFALPLDVDTMISTNLETKRRALIDVHDVTVVAPSAWLTNASAHSALLGKFKHHHIPYGLDANVFCPRNKRFSKELFGFPLHKRCILFVSDDVGTVRKGFQFLDTALNQLKESTIFACTVGTNTGKPANRQLHSVGRIEDERLMSLLYSAADAFVIPSLEDNLPNTVLESLMCGTPVIGFPTGGIRDMVEDGFNGFLSAEISVQGLQNAIRRFLDEGMKLDREAIRQRAVEKYDESVQANAYLSLYQKILEK